MGYGVVIPDEEVFIVHKHRKQRVKEADDGNNAFRLHSTTPEGIYYFSQGED